MALRYRRMSEIYQTYGEKFDGKFWNAKRKKLNDEKKSDFEKRKPQTALFLTLYFNFETIIFIVFFLVV